MITGYASRVTVIVEGEGSLKEYTIVDCLSLFAIGAFLCLNLD